MYFTDSSQKKFFY